MSKRRGHLLLCDKQLTQEALANDLPAVDVGVRNWPGTLNHSLRLLESQALKCKRRRL
jgi:hypothetical protein